jgi:hypothetical protein
MNCPSKNDNVLMNPGWNQSPPRFAADLTTCADLNGIANNRELGDADCLSNGSRNLRHLELGDSHAKEMGKMPWEVGLGVKGSSRGDSNFPTMTAEYDGLTLAQDLAPEQPYLCVLSTELDFLRAGAPGCRLSWLRQCCFVS